MDSAKRRLPIGAEILPQGGVHFRVWAPRRREVEILLEAGADGGPASVRLAAEGNGYFSGRVGQARAGTLYRFRLDGQNAFPDPASRFQPQGPHGASQVVDPRSFRWTDAAWKGSGPENQVLYEMHIGTFTQEGTWEAAADQLQELKELGITILEIMPVAEFPGRFGWGYDGVYQFAPTRLYGEPDDFRRFVDRAHAVGLGVILDVVYNHFGPDGCYLREFSEHYFSARYKNEWGEPINFDDEFAGPVREFFVANAACWIDEYHLDGFRFDATQQIFDASGEHILAAVVRAARQAGQGKTLLMIAENEMQHSKLARPPERGGYGMDMLWNDDFHHSAAVALTEHNEAYYHDYLGAPQEFISAAKYGYLFQGQWYAWQQKRRGTPAFDLKPQAFITFIENHDQVANSGRGERSSMLTSRARYRAMTGLWLLLPSTPLFFQGQEFAASSPFLFFADHQPDLARLVHKGRKEFLSQFSTLALPASQAAINDPADLRTFELCKLNFGERKLHAWAYDLHRDLLRLRRAYPLFRSQQRGALDGAVLGPEAFVLRFFGAEGNDALLLVNFGRDLRLERAPEPLLAPPEGCRWHILWTSEDPRYGGYGTPPLDTEANWLVPGETTVALIPQSLGKSGSDAEPE
jgi:maltooligosyltrehalose trehalohydrolase